MAKMTREDGKKPGPVAVLEPPSGPSNEEAAPPDDPETQTEAEETEESAAATPGRRGRPAAQDRTGFFATLSGYSQVEWERLMLYVYRIAPITDRLATGNRAKYIAKYGQPIDEDTLLKEHGSGTYRLTLNKVNDQGKHTTIGRYDADIENVKFPPVVPIGEWVDDPANKRWAWAKQKIDQAAQPAAPAQPASSGPKISELITAVRDLKELSKEAAPPPAPAPPDPVAQLKGTVEAVSSIVALAKPDKAEKPAEDPMMKFIVDRLAASEDRNSKLMDRLLDKQNAPVPAPAADPLRDLAMKMLEKRLDKMDEPAAESADARASRLNGTQELIVELGKVVAPVLEKALGLFTVIATAKAAAVPQPRRPHAQTVDATAIAPVQPGQPEPAPAAPETQEQPQPQEPPRQIDPKQAMLNFILSQVTPTMMDHLENGDGTSFAEWFCGMVIQIPNVPPPVNKLPGSEALKFAKQFGKQAIIDAYRGAPELWQQIAPSQQAEEHFSQFLDDFLAYDPDAPEEEEEDQ